MKHVSFSCTNLTAIPDHVSHPTHTSHCKPCDRTPRFSTSSHFCKRHPCPLVHCVHPHHALQVPRTSLPGREWNPQLRSSTPDYHLSVWGGSAWPKAMNCHPLDKHHESNFSYTISNTSSHIHCLMSVLGRIHVGRKSLLGQCALPRLFTDKDKQEL